MRNPVMRPLVCCPELVLLIDLIQDSGQRVYRNGFSFGLGADPFGPCPMGLLYEQRSRQRPKGHWPLQ
jgi:hypothetical protein